MTALRTHTPTDAGQHGPRLAKRRRIGVAIAGAALVLVSGIASLGLYLTASHRTAVLAVTQPVAQGERFSSANVDVVEVADATGMAVLTERDAKQLFASTARVALRRGTVLSPDVVMPPTEAGEVVVAASLGVGSAPPLRAGDHVTIVATSAAKSSVLSGGASTKVADVMGVGDVVDVRTPGGGTLVVSLRVARGISADVAAASSTGGLALVADVSDAGQRRS